MTNVKDFTSVSMLANEVFEDQAVASEWLEKPNMALGGQVPMVLCETEEGIQQVLRVLRALEYGGVA